MAKQGSERARAIGNSVDMGTETVFTQVMTFPTTSTTTHDFLAARDEWVSLGRPADHPYAIAAAEVYASADGPAIGFRRGDQFVTVEL